MAASPNDHRPIPGSERPRPPGSTLIGPVPPTENVAVTILLRRKPDSPDLPDLQHWQDTRPGERQFLSAEQFHLRHGAAPEDLDAVINYLKGRGLKIVEQHAGRRRLVAEGIAAEINAAFGITLNRYQHPGRARPAPIRNTEARPFGDHLDIPNHIHRGFDGPARLPAKLIGIVAAVIGLDNRHLGLPAGTGTGDPPGAAYLSPATIAERYNFPTLPAFGQTIGLFESAGAGAAYLASDITKFIHSLPGGATAPLPHLADILQPGFINNPANVTYPPSGAVFECTIDVAIAAATARGANINVYFSSGDEAGWVWFLDRAIFPDPGDNAPSVLSASWVPYLSDDPATIGSLANPSSPVSILTFYLQAAAARGITVLMAIGDWGSNNLVGGVSCHVSYPNADPWVTSCGGTILGAANPSPPPLHDEWTWSDAHLASPFDLAPYEATGGGVSDTFPRPPYQVAAGILPISKNDGNVRRGVPDVAGMVAMSGFFVAGVGGPGLNGGVGTSAVAPLYAGLVVVINKFLGRNVGFLNPTLYEYAPQICNDIIIGNNDSGDVPDAPFYTAGIGWDACTGWGSLNGVRLLAAIAPAPIIATSIAGGGNFGEICAGSFADFLLTINNSGFSPLLIWKIDASPAAIEAPAIAAYPLAVSPGASIDVTIRCKPAAAGTTAGKITIFSNDLLGPHSIPVSVTALTGKLAVTGSTFFGAVCACRREERTISICNVGDCKLHVASVAFKRPSRHWKLVNNPFPATLHPGSCLAVVIRYKATEKFPRACELVITSDDPTMPVKTLDVVAATIWSDCGCRKCNCDPCKCQTRSSDCDVIEDDDTDDP